MTGQALKAKKLHVKIGNVFCFVYLSINKALERQFDEVGP